MPRYVSHIMYLDPAATDFVKQVVGTRYPNVELDVVHTPGKSSALVAYTKATIHNRLMLQLQDAAAVAEIAHRVCSAR